MNNIQYMFRFGLTPEKILALDVDKLKISHLDYAFIYLTEDGALTSTKEQEPVHGNIFVDNEAMSIFEALSQLRKEHPSVSIMLSLGGGDRQQSTCFRTVAADKDKVQRLGRACAQYLDKFGFDGIDVDWEYPENQEEIKQYIYLLQVIRENIGQDRLLSSALPVGRILANFEPCQVSEINDIMDFWNLMTYDLGLFQEYSFVAPYSTRSETEVYGYSSLSDGIYQFHKIGVPYDRMNVGVPSYGKYWTEITDLSLGDLGHFFGKKYEGPRPKTLHLNRLLPILQEDGWNEHWVEGAGCPIYFRTDGDKITQLIAMDDTRSIDKKCQLIASLKCAGFMMWCLNGDSDDKVLLKTIAKHC